MPTKAFNDRWLKSVKPSDATDEYTDAGCPCLTVRVGKRSKSFNVMVGPKGARRRIRIGVYPAMSISAARRQAESLAQDPQAQAGGKPVEYETRDVGTVEDLFEMVLAAMREEGKAEETIDDYEHYLLTGRASAASEFGRAMAAKDVTPRMATAWLAKFRARGSSSRLPRAILSAAFSRGVKADNNPDTFATTRVRFGIPFNPVANVGGQTQSNSLDRYLSLDELTTFWQDLKPPVFTAETGLLARMLIAMGGVSVTEVCRSRNDMWIDKGDWKTLDAGMLKLPKTKNGRKHEHTMTLRPNKIGASG